MGRLANADDLSDNECKSIESFGANAKCVLQAVATFFLACVILPSSANTFKPN